MSIKEEIRGIFQNLSLTLRMRLSIVVMGVAMTAIVFFMFVSIFTLKYDHETLFQKRTLPLVQLQEIKHLYASVIRHSLGELQNDPAKRREVETVVIETREKIEKLWLMYYRSVNIRIGGLPKFASEWLSLFLLSDGPGMRKDLDLEFVEQTEVDMRSIDLKLVRLFTMTSDQTLHASPETLSDIYRDIDSLIDHLSDLIDSHIDEAVAEKERTDRYFDNSLFILVLLIGMVFVFSLLILAGTIEHFRKLHVMLSQKVDEKTRELKLLNESLEVQIKKEIQFGNEKEHVIVQQSRLASLGEMMQNIAHQWRQSLSTITMIIQSFESKRLAGKLTDEFVSSRVVDAQLLAQNMSETLDDFRTFFEQNKEKKMFSLRRAVQKALDLTRYLLESEGIKLKLFFDQDCNLFGYKHEITHVMLNLLNNAKDAFDPRRDDKFIWVEVFVREKSVFMSVMDNAGGIDESILSHIFDPYFTTKGDKDGTGIGLYMSRRLIAQHMEGTITCQNVMHSMDGESPYRCARFEIEIPLPDLEEQGESA